ncbi:MAG TPA: amidase domain-containing protein [Candidatus Saccharimonadales bacterium]|nr:amidase domain-containing protein [Candidatus Saccharimonadales bacterium]
MPELLEQTSPECTALPLVTDGELTDHLYAPGLLEETPLPAPESPATLAVAETVGVGFTSNPSERPTLHSRIFRHVGRIAAVAAAGLGFAFGASTVDAGPAEASSDKVYTTTDNVYLHADPGLGDKGDLIKIMPKGTKFTADCYVNDTPIGKRNNPAWLHGTDETGATGYFTDAYSDSHWDRNNTLHDQGLAFCGEKNNSATTNSTEQPQNHEANPQYTGKYDRDRAVSWALANAEIQPPSDGACTWFASNVLWQGGLPKTSGWTSEGFLGRDIPLLGERSEEFPGTISAWNVNQFREYLRETYPESDWMKLDFSKNAVPQATPGDLIFYDWGKGEGISHVAVVTNTTPSQYPEVSEWSPGADGSEPAPYAKRGWTWSGIRNEWLQVKYPHIKAYLLHVNTTNMRLAP